MLKQRIYALVLTIVMVVGIFAPLTAFAEGTDGIVGESGVVDSGELATPSSADSALETDDAATSGESCLPEDETCAAPVSAEDGGMVLMSGWEGGGSEFYTKIRLTVTDRNGNPIQGATYGLYRMSDDSLVEYLTTDSYGVALSNDVPVDTDYYLLEYSAPEGYYPNPERKDIRLTEICAPSRVDEVVVYDPILGSLKVIKTDEDGNPLSGVGFYVYRESDWSLVDTIYTNQNGEAFSHDLRYGWYQLYEFDVPDDFAGGGYSSVFVGDTGEGYAEVTVINYKARGYAYVYKTGNDGHKISGAVFGVYQSDDTWIEDITTGSNGYAYTSNLLRGDYYLVEKSVPSPYAADTTTKHNFTIAYSGASVYIPVENKVAGDPGKLKIIKTDDGANPVPLSGVTFGLYRAWDSYKLGELTTGSDGTVQSGELIPGDYYIVELSGKTGYTMASGQIAFTIDGSGVTVEKTVVNSKMRVFGKVQVIKMDDAGNPIPGVRFGVYCHADNLLEELVTGADGKALSGVLNEGAGYYLKELEGAAGYLSDPDAVYGFDITENNVIVPVSVTNPRITGAIKIIKDDGAGNPLGYVLFGVFRAGTGDKVCELTTDSDGTAMSGPLFYGDYELLELAGVEGYEHIAAPIPFSISEQGVILEIPVSNPLILGSVRVLKLDGDLPPIPLSAAAQDGEVTAQSANPLAGAVFGIYNGRGQKIAEITTDENGEAERGGLPVDNYFLRELTAPEGYILQDDMIPFSIGEQGQVAYITAPNAKGSGTLNIMKYGEGETPLPGVTFEVYRESTGAKMDTITTGDNGKASVTLPLGRYSLKETATAEGYILPTGTVSFSLTADGATVALSLQNQKSCVPEDGRIKLIKKSETDGALLKGAVFGIYRASDDEKVGELTTGDDGTAVSSALSEANYYLKELAAPSGFELSSAKTAVSVKPGQTAEITITNKPLPEPAAIGQVKLIKAADGTGKKLPGAVYGLYKSGSDEKVCELTTGSDGTATSPALPESDYYLKEIKAPSGFQLSGDKVAVHVKAGETVEITVTDYPVDVPTPTAKVKIIKTADGTNEKLKDAVFGIYRASDDVQAAELTTGSDGTVTSPSLPAGDYYYKELRAPSGYKLLTEKVTFALKADEVKELTVKNEKLPADTGTLLVVKKAEGTGKLLADAVFGVYTASGNTKVAEITTAGDGTASIELNPGDYYLKELRAPASYVAEANKIPFKVKTNTTVKIEVTNTQGRGTVKLLKVDEAGKPLSGGVFTLYRNDGTELAELTTKADGTAAYELPIGGYYLLEKTAPVGYRLEPARYGFTIENGKTADVKVVNKAIVGTVEVYFKHVQDGRGLAPMKSYTDKIGADYIRWMRDNGYENMPIDGYNLIRTDYPSSFVLIDGKLVVTLWYDNPAGTIHVPKTGETPPYMNYAFALLSWSVAALCGVLLYRMKKQGKLTAAR